MTVRHKAASPSNRILTAFSNLANFSFAFSSDKNWLPKPAKIDQEKTPKNIQRLGARNASKTGNWWKNQKIGEYLTEAIRENKMITGAGADRMQTGMQLSFGKSIGKAAVVKPGDRIFFIAVPNEKAVIFTRKIIKQLKPKLPCRTRVDYKFLA